MQVTLVTLDNPNLFHLPLPHRPGVFLSNYSTLGTYDLSHVYTYLSPGFVTSQHPENLFLIRFLC